MKGKPKIAPVKKKTPLYDRIREILESARTRVARSVNTTQVVANWLIGREIVEEEQKGQRRAGYGEQLLEDLSLKLTHDFGTGYSVPNLRFIRQLCLTYPAFLGDPEIRYALRSESPNNMELAEIGIPHAVRKESGKVDAAPVNQIGHALRGQSWQPGQIHPNLSWTHYRTLLRVDKPEARGFYEIEAIYNNWSTRELERQINSLLYERLALSKEKKGLMRLATKGQELQSPADVFKDPVVMEFLGLPASPRLVESDLEQALIHNLQAFLLELGKGFAFVSRQERITLDKLYLPTEAELQAEMRRELREISRPFAPRRDQ